MIRHRDHAADAFATSLALLAGCAVLALIAPPASGPIRLVLAFEVQCFIAAIVAGTAAAAVWRSRRLLVAVAVVGALAAIGFSPDWESPPADARSDLTVVTWNLEVGTLTPADATEALRRLDADVVALQEVVPEQIATIAADRGLAAGYPYRFAAPAGGTLGIEVLSRFPLEGGIAGFDPAAVEIAVDTPEGPVTLFVAHPLPDFLSYAPLPIPIRLSDSREADVRRLRARVDAALGRGERVLVVGDFNTTPTEPAYAVLATGLRDLHMAVGNGPGWTWRPGVLAPLGVGLLRIDFQLAGRLVPAWTRVDCRVRGDHCQLFGGYRLD